MQRVGIFRDILKTQRDRGSDLKKNQYRETISSPKEDNKIPITRKWTVKWIVSRTSDCQGFQCGQRKTGSNQRTKNTPGSQEKLRKEVQEGLRQSRYEM